MTDKEYIIILNPDVEFESPCWIDMEEFVEDNKGEIQVNADTIFYNEIAIILFDKASAMTFKMLFDKYIFDIDY